ncbi:MAG: hypothetical protein OXF61_05760 [Acidimicrobiaceae bacterium]|nr:hypothetical protein [Acidimicrobiaceae bacterium]
MTDEFAPSDDSNEPNSAIAPAASVDGATAETIDQIAHRVVEIFHEVSTVESYSGPLPPASEFALYEDAVPGSGERIIGLAENTSKRTYEAHLDDNRLGRHLLWSLVALGAIFFVAQVIVSRDLISAGSVELGSVASSASAVFVGIGVLLTWRRGRRTNQDSTE